MTATDELRRLLDERGVKWRLVNGDCLLWTDADGATYSARDGFTFAGPDGTLTVFSMAPEQAVAATLGPACEPPIAARWDGDVLAELGVEV